MKILVTGGAGFIGKAVCEELRARFMQPIVFDGDADVRDAKAVERAMRDVQGVINLAGVLGTAETIGSEYHAAEVNILGAMNVMDAAKHIPMVQIATGHEGQPNPYAITKKCITDLALSRAQWTGQEITVVRAYHAYGPGQKMYPPHGKSGVRKIIPSFVARALTGMPIEINGDGLQQIDLVYVDEVAMVLVNALNSNYGKVIEAGTGTPTTVIDAAKTVISACGSKSVIEHVKMRSGEPEGTTVVATDAMCPHSWPYKLSETIQWYRDQIAYGKAAVA